LDGKALGGVQGAGLLLVLTEDFGSLGIGENSLDEGRAYRTSGRERPTPCRLDLKSCNPREKEKTMNEEWLQGTVKIRNEPRHSTDIIKKPPTDVKKLSDPV
jgi:hypothetical protein